MFDVNILEIISEVNEAFMLYKAAIIARDDEELHALLWNTSNTIRSCIAHRRLPVSSATARRWI